MTTYSNINETLVQTMDTAVLQANDNYRNRVSANFEIRCRAWIKLKLGSIDYIRQLSSGQLLGMV